MNTLLELETTDRQVALDTKPVKGVKCVVWDIDHTLWDGVLSEGDAVVLKPNIVEILNALDSRGILNSIASKNEHGDVMCKLEEFGIAKYFLYPQICWNAKSVGIGSIQQNLNIGMDTILFIDDQSFELDEVATAHPTINCMHSDAYLTLLEDPRLSPSVISEDAGRRRLMYLEDMARKREEAEFVGTPESFLATLGMEFDIASAKHTDLMRAEELTVRTNQLNSTGITYDMEELSRYIQSDTYRLLICELTDKYGSYGKIGLALVERSSEYDHIKLLLMSCRTVSRGVGSVLLSFLMKQAAKGGKKLRADFRRTERNRQMLVTYQLSNFKEIARTADGMILFENDLSTIQDYPSYIKVHAE